MVQLSLYVPQEGGGPHAEQLGVSPLAAQLLFHERQPGEGVLSVANTA